MMTNERLETDKKSIDDTGIQRTEMQKEIVISRHPYRRGKFITLSTASRPP